MPRVLDQGGLGTLMLDLLTEAEEQVDLNTRHLRFDIGLLAGRLREATEWLRKDSRTSGLAVACFGAGTGGGAALVAAADSQLLSVHLSRVEASRRSCVGSRPPCLSSGGGRPRNRDEPGSSPAFAQPSFRKP